MQKQTLTVYSLTVVTVCLELAKNIGGKDLLKGNKVGGVMQVSTTGMLAWCPFCGCADVDRRSYEGMEQAICLWCGANVIGVDVEYMWNERCCDIWHIRDRVEKYGG